MNGTDDFIVRLEAYLDDFDGATPLPDHVRDAVHAALAGTRPGSPVRVPRRLLDHAFRQFGAAPDGESGGGDRRLVVVGGATPPDGAGPRGLGAPSATRSDGFPIAHPDPSAG